MTFGEKFGTINVYYYKGGIFIEREIFSDWYSSLDLNPMTSELLFTCLKNSVCDSCRFRQKCPIRPLFYMDDMDFEMRLQIVEIQTKQQVSQILPISSEMAEEQEFISIQKLRFKRMRELDEHSDYSEE